MRIVHSCSILCLLLSLFVLVGWQLDSSILKRPLSMLGTMNPTTALCLSFLSGAILLFSTTRKWYYYLGYLFVGLSLILSAFRIVEGWFLWSSFSDQTLFLRKLQEQIAESYRHMSANTAFSFVLLSIATWLLSFRKARLAQILAGITILITWFTILGYLYQVPEFYELISYLPMSIYTAIGIMLLSVSVLGFYPDQGLVSEINGEYQGGRMARVLLPVVFIIPLLFGYLRLWIQQWTSTELGVTLMVVSITLVFATVVMISVILLNQQDAKRSLQQLATEQSNKQLQKSYKEIASLNDELNATHEEMVAANEELSAANEELSIMNEQLHSAADKIREQSEIIIKQKDEHLNHALDATDVIIWSVDLTGKGQNYISRSSERITGISSDEFLKQRDTWNKMVHPDDMEIRRAALQRLEQIGFTDEVLRIIDKDAKVRWMHLQLRIVKDEAGKPLRQEGMISDISSLKESERALAQERYLLRSLIDNVPDYIFVKDKSLRYIVNNKANLQLMGAVTEEQTLNKTSVEYLGPAAEQFEEADRKILTSGESVINKEETLHHASAEEKMVLTTKVPLYDPSGGIAGVIGISRDITESRKRERLLNQYRENLDVIFRSTIEEILLLDKDGKVVLFNNALEKFIIYSTGKKPVIGNYLWETTVDERKELAKDLFLQARSGKSLTTEAYVKTPSGMIVHELRYQPIYISGEVKYVMIISMDITERRNNENNIRKSQANLRAIFDTTADIFIMLDMDMNIQIFNESFKKNNLLQRGVEVKEGINIVDLLLPERQEIFRSYLERAKRGEVVEYDVHGKQDENVAWFHVVVTPVRDNYRQVIGICVTSHDLTARKHAEEEKSNLVRQLIEQNNDLLQFSFIASHNLRGPVASMLGLLNLFNREQLTPENNHLISLLGNSVSRLDSVIRDLSLILSMRSDALLSKEWVKISDMVEDIRAALQTQMDESEVELFLSDVEVDSFLTIKSYLHSILYNLITNAIKYRSKLRNPVIRIVTFKNESGIGFTVEDNGMGIDMTKFKEKIFKLYQRFHLDVEGRGLGLYMVHTQTQLLNGTIEVQSTLDQGTRFTIQFPVSDVR